MRTFLLIVLAAFVASIIAPFIAYLGSSYMPAGVFYDWFFELPGAMYSLFGGAETVSDAVVMMVCIYFVQHLVVFLIAWTSLPITRVVSHFLTGLRHRRTGLLRR